ncbi:hypothetical protein [Sphingobacterium corticibacter]|uniref:hypothetical protein n=1 Tax=Sphingobacterium corticibacter TaxID=2171749 RepID=UPI001057F882|nr:hypothetical protein [Sphingobacterium corticibacter]
MCRVSKIHPLRDHGGAGILVVAEVITMHLDEEILDEDSLIDPLKVRQVASLGGDYYIDARPEYLFKIPKPIATRGIGVDNLPKKVKQNPTLTGNHLWQLANVAKIPSMDIGYHDPSRHSGWRT